MKTIRAKFECTTIQSKDWGEEVRLYAVHGNDDKDNEENNQFSEATPSGNLEMTISNPAAKGFFKEGKDYYLDFTEADDTVNPTKPGGPKT